MCTTTLTASPIIDSTFLGQDLFLVTKPFSLERPACAELACRVAIPPGCPVFQASKRSRASSPLTSPTKILSGLKRRVAFNNLVIERSTVDLI